MRCPAEVGGVIARVSTADLLGYPVCQGTPADILELLWQRVQCGDPTHVITLNPEMVMRGQRDAAARQWLHAGDVYVADGVGLAWAAGVLGLKGVERYPGINLAEDLLRKLARVGGKVFLLGAKPGVADQAAAKLLRDFPGLLLAGVQHGYYSNAELDGIVQTISAQRADLLLVGMGSPKQEEFIAAHRRIMGTPLMIGVGGSLEVWAGVKQRAPRWVQRSGCEWVYRTASDVSRLKRLGVLPAFMALVLATSLRGGK